MSGGARWLIDRSLLVSAVARQAAVEGLEDGAEFLLEEANRTVPIEEATLERSGTVSSSRQGSNASRVRAQAAVSYDTSYAVRQHEDQTLRHDEGRRAKWLEATLKERADTIRDKAVSKIKAVLT